MKYSIAALAMILGVCTALIPTARALQTITDVTTQSPNTTHYTSYVNWKTQLLDLYFSGIRVTDSVVYSPGETFVNTGTLTLGAIANLSDVLVGIGNDNATIAIQNTGNITISYLTVNRDIEFFGIDTDGSLINSGNITLSTDQTGIQENQLTGLLVNGNSLVNTGDITLDSRNGIGAVASTFHYTTTGIQFSGSQMSQSGELNVTVEGPEVTLFTNKSAIAIGIESSGNLTHTGEITATAIGGKLATTSTDATAYGIKMTGTATLHSTGLIQARAQPSPGLPGGN
ncbi:MAG: hypothetical protein MI747_00780, partial [Desulfobacterales bacterium]|nr:hypothetical protein [Desulfobacterales bacterium]